ncbi:heat shock protein beta-7-like [Coregonus clupeaformis]|uniref:heat shock protein beta-7-like n=1 Tax=Coregonus clupeaformis TaxID=59861 RepID=UPI001BE0E21D|nr:heat shock protein beta-7-like [Coregonus clupeaformis]
MALTSSSSSRSSSSSYHSSARYSSSSTYWSEGSGGGAADPLFDPFLEAAGVGPPKPVWRGGGCSPPVWPPSADTTRTPTGYPAIDFLRPNKWHCARSFCQYGRGQIVGGSYYMSADVSQFQPQDIVVMAYNHNIVIHAEKVLENGRVSDTFTHKTMLPTDMDPLSISGTLTPEGMLVVSVRRKPTMGVLEPPAPPA